MYTCCVRFFRLVNLFLRKCSVRLQHSLQQNEECYLGVINNPTKIRTGLPGRNDQPLVASVMNRRLVTWFLLFFLRYNKPFSMRSEQTSIIYDSASRFFCISLLNKASFISITSRIASRILDFSIPMDSIFSNCSCTYSTRRLKKAFALSRSFST